MVTRGFYRHYKGPIYFVLGVGVLDGETRPLVIYESTQSVRDGRLRHRYEDLFVQWVDPRRDGQVVSTPAGPDAEAQHRARGFLPRFERVGEG